MNECFNSHSRIFETDLFTLVKKRTNFMEYSRSYMKTAKHTVEASNALFFPSHSSFSNHIVSVSPSAVTHSLMVFSQFPILTSLLFLLTAFSSYSGTAFAINNLTLPAPFPLPPSGRYSTIFLH